MLEGDEYDDHLLGDPNQLDDIIEARDANLHEEGDDNEDGDAGDQEQDGDNPKNEKQKRTRVLNPQPKLDAERLTGPRGIAIIENLFRDFKFYGSGYEDQDLKRIMKRLELWGNRLFPKFQFDDLLEKIERLGHKRPVLNFVNKIRMGMVNEDSVAENPRKENDVMEVDESDLNGYSVGENVHTDDTFNQLLEEQRSLPHTQQSQYSITPTEIQTTITDEQKERMMRNRQLAEERRLARIRAQEERNSVNSQSNAIPGNETGSAIGQTTDVAAVEQSLMLESGGLNQEENKVEDVIARKVEQVSEHNENCIDMDNNVVGIADLGSQNDLHGTDDIKFVNVDQDMRKKEIFDSED